MSVSLVSSYLANQFEKLSCSVMYIDSDFIFSSFLLGVFFQVLVTKMSTSYIFKYIFCSFFFVHFPWLQRGYIGTNVWEIVSHFCSCSFFPYDMIVHYSYNLYIFQILWFFFSHYPLIIYLFISICTFSLVIFFITKYSIVPRAK